MFYMAKYDTAFFQHLQCNSLETHICIFMKCITGFKHSVSGVDRSLSSSLRYNASLAIPGTIVVLQISPHSASNVRCRLYIDQGLHPVVQFPDLGSVRH